MGPVGSIAGFDVVVLTRALAAAHVDEILALVRQIHAVEYTPEKVLAESKEGRIFYGKWEHSLLVLDGEVPIAVLIAYEREAEKNDHYPENTLYVSELAVKQEYQRRTIGKQLLLLFLERSAKHGFLHLDGELTFSIQTNVEGWNANVTALYRSLGFRERARKDYGVRVDAVMGRDGSW